MLTLQRVASFKLMFLFVEEGGVMLLVARDTAYTIWTLHKLLDDTLIELVSLVNDPIEIVPMLLSVMPVKLMFAVSLATLRTVNVVTFDNDL